MLIQKLGLDGCLDRSAIFFLLLIMLSLHRLDLVVRWNLAAAVVYSLQAWQMDDKKVSWHIGFPNKVGHSFQSFLWKGHLPMRWKINAHAIGMTRDCGTHVWKKQSLAKGHSVKRLCSLHSEDFQRAGTGKCENLEEYWGGKGRIYGHIKDNFNKSWIILKAAAKWTDNMFDLQYSFPLWHKMMRIFLRSFYLCSILAQF